MTMAQKKASEQDDKDCAIVGKIASKLASLIILN